MLIPLTRSKFEELVPLTGTSDQYRYYWGKFPDLLRRLLISVMGGALTLLLEVFFAQTLGPLILLFGICVGLYWLWGPVFLATRRNLEYRQYPYSGFWEGEVLDVYISEELIGTEETVNNRGELVIVENRERRLNLEVGDEAGFVTQLQVPIKRGHQAIIPGLPVQMVMMSYQPDLSRIADQSDLYIPSHKLWVSNYPLLQRTIFLEVSRQLMSGDFEDRETRRPRKSRKGTRKNSSRKRREALDL